MGKFPKTLSQENLVDYILDRGESFIKTYEGFKSMMIGDSVEKTITLSNGNSFNVKFESIRDSIYEDKLIKENNSVKVWPTFNLDYNSYLFYNQEGNINSYNSRHSSDILHSMIRIGESDEKYHHINVQVKDNQAILFIVLDKILVDGSNFEFVVNFMFSDMLTTEVKLPQVVFIDGSSNNIEICDGGAGIKIDGIKFSYTKSTNGDFTKFNNVDSLDINDAILMSYDTLQILDNRQYEGFEAKFKKYDELIYNNYGLYDSEKIKIFKNDEHVLISRNIQKTGNKWGNAIEAYPYTDSFGILTLVCPANSSYVFGLSDNNYIRNNSVFNQDFIYNIDILNNINLRSDYLIDSIPNQFNIDINTPFETFNCSHIMHVRIVPAVYDGALRIRMGLTNEDLGTSVLFKNINEYYTHSEANGASTNKVIGNSQNEVDVISYVIFDKNKLYTKIYVFDKTNIICESEEISTSISNISTYIPYCEYYLDAGSTTSTVDITKIRMINNLTPDQVRDYLKLVNISIDNDYDNNKDPMSTKYLPIKNINGYLTSINPTVKLNYEKNIILNDIEIKKLTYRVSTIYNLNKSDFYYINKNWNFTKYGSLSSKYILKEGPCTLFDDSIDFTSEGIFNDSVEYYGEYSPSVSNSSLFSGKYKYGIDNGILFNNCNTGYVTTYVTSYVNKISSKHLIVEYGYDPSMFSTDLLMVETTPIQTFKFGIPHDISQLSSPFDSFYGLYLNRTIIPSNRSLMDFLNPNLNIGAQYNQFITNSTYINESGDRNVDQLDIHVNGKLTYTLDNRVLIYSKLGVDRVLSQGVNEATFGVKKPCSSMLGVLPVEYFIVKSDSVYDADSTRGQYFSQFTPGSDTNIRKIKEDLRNLLKTNTSLISIDDELYNPYSRLIYSYDILDSNGNVTSTTTVKPTSGKYLAYATGFIISIGSSDNNLQINLDTSDVYDGSLLFTQSTGQYFINYYPRNIYSSFNFLATSEPVIDLKWYVKLTNNNYKSVETIVTPIQTIVESTEKTPSFIEITNNYAHIEHSRLESEYVDEYRDSPINCSGWKIFGMYQLPINI